MYLNRMESDKKKRRKTKTVKGRIPARDALDSNHNSQSHTNADKDLASLGPLWRADDVAEYLAVSKRTLWRLVCDGRLCEPDVRLGRIVRWNPQTVINHIQRNSDQD